MSNIVCYIIQLPTNAFCGFRCGGSFLGRTHCHGRGTASPTPCGGASARSRPPCCACCAVTRHGGQRASSSLPRCGARAPPQAALATESHPAGRQHDVAAALLKPPVSVAQIRVSSNQAACMSIRSDCWGSAHLRWQACLAARRGEACTCRNNVHGEYPNRRPGGFLSRLFRMHGPARAAVPCSGVEVNTRWRAALFLESGRSAAAVALHLASAGRSRHASTAVLCHVVATGAGRKPVKDGRCECARMHACMVRVYVVCVGMCGWHEHAGIRCLSGVCAPLISTCTSSICLKEGT